MIKNLFQSEFIKNTSTLISGTAIAQAIPILVSPVLSRLYSPDDFGILALFMSIGIVLSVIATGRYELAIMLPASKEDATNILALSIILSFITAILTLVLVLLLADRITIFFDEPSIKFWLYFLPVVVFSGGIFNAFNYWSTRHKTFKKNAISRVSQSTAMVGTNLGVGFTKSGPVGLVAGYIIGMITAGLVLSWSTLKQSGHLLKDVSIARMKKNATKYRNFPRINTPHAFIGSLQDNGIIYVIMLFFSKSILGSYSFAFRVVTAPVALIGSSIHQVFFQRANQAHQDGENIQQMVLRLYKNLFVLGLPVFTILFFFAPPIFGFIFGKEWTVAGEIASIISPWLFLNFIANPVSSVTVIMNKQKEGMMLSIADIGLKIVAITIGGLYGDFRLTFVLMSILCGTLLLFSLYLFYKFAGLKNKKTY